MNYFQQWSAIAVRRNWRDNILTRRTDKEFEAEEYTQTHTIPVRINGLSTIVFEVDI